MYSRKVLITAAAVVAIGVAFAAEPTSDDGLQGTEALQQRAPWVPGADMVMSAHEPSIGPLAPPR